MKKRKLGRKLLSFLLTLAMVVGLLPGMSLTAYAADEVSENISLVASPSAGLKTISGTHYSVSCGYMVAAESGMQVCKAGALTINARKGETITKVVLTYNWGNNKSSLSASAGTFDGNATISDINAQQVTISSSNDAGVKISAVTVYFEGSLSNPTVTLTGGANAKSSGGLLTQSYLPGAMDTVTYTALTGATFPAFENFTQNGVTVERTSDTVVTVSGTPTANTEITVPDAESSSKIVTWGSSIINTINGNGYSDTANGITLTKSGSGNVGSGDWYTYGSLELNFTTATGKFTSIEIETSQIYGGGNWTKDGNTLKWNGTPSNSVSLSGSGLYLEGVSSINFVIEMPTVSVTITPGSNMTKTTDSGAAEQTGLTGPMTDVVYTADEGYYFPENYSVDAVNGISVTRNSYTQITVSGTPTADASITLTAPTAKTTPDAPTAAAATDCTTTANNDGKLTGVTAEMEYKNSDATEWTAGTGSDITGLVPGTYYVRVKATDATNASTNQELTIKGFISYTVTFKVVNGKWNEGEGDAATADKTVTLTGHDGDTLKLTTDQIPAVDSKPNDTYKAGSWDTTPSADTEITAATTYTYTYARKDSISQTVTFKVVNGSWNDETTTDKTVTLTGYEGDTLKLTADQIPAVGDKPNDTYKAGSWDVIPNTDAAITEATTYTYTYVAKEASVVTKAPEAKTLTYNGQAQELVTAGTATGGEMQYALGNATEATGPYTTSIPTGTDAGTYYVWYKVIGDANHNDSEAGFVEAKINPVDKKDLNNAIEEAEAYYNTIKVNSDYSEQKEALGSAISTAKLLAGNDNVTAAEVSEGITAVNSAKTTAETAVEGIIESNKEAFAAEKTTQKKNADSLAKDGDSDASRKLIEDAKKAIDAIDFDNTKTLEDNKAALADIITKLTDNLTTQRAADKLASDKVAFEVEKTTKQKVADALSEELDSDASKKLITDAKAAIEALTYDETKSLDVNKAAIEAVITSLKTDLGTQRAEDLATNKEAFGADKETQKKAADALAADGDSDASKRLIEDAKKAIDEPAYDETKSLDENKAALAAIVSKLKDELTAKRAEEKKEAADKAAADKVIEAINTLPAKEDVTASDKEAVEAARAAYDALTASQKDKIDTATLQKLTDAEEALVALGELDKNVVAFNSEKNVQKAEAVKLAKEDDSDAVRKLIADAREAIDALAYDKNKSLDENKAVLAAIITELGNALEEQRELEKILAVVKIDQGETVAEVDKTAIKEEDVETVTNVAKSTDADLSEAATTCVKQIVEESKTVEDSDKNIVIVPALDVKGKEYSVTETDATMTLDIEAVYTSYETTSDITTATDVKLATEAEDETEKAKVKEIGSGKLDTEGTPVNVKIEVPAAFAGVLGATTETVKASPATIYVKHTHKNKNYEYNASLYCEGSKYFVEFVNPNGFSPFTLSGNSASVASIGDKNYTDLQSAIDDAADGSTIKLTNDNDVSAAINTEKTITIDKDNHTGNVDIKAADTLLLTKTDNENGTTTYKTVTKYTVTFDNNGGKGTMPAQEIGGTAALNANAFTKEGYTFDGWNTKSDGSGTAYADKADVTPTADMTLYAQWKENPKPDDKDKTDAEVEAVKTKINALKAADKITTEDKAAIEAADKAYDALSEARKKLIDAATLKKLTDAKAALKAAEKAESDKAAADAVKTRINALKAADKITTTDKAAIEEARKAYDALSADQKKLVDAATLKKLTDAEKALTTAEANDKAAKELEAAKEEAQAAMNEQVTVTQKGNKFTVKWKKASSADGYYVYARYCGKKITKPEKIIEKNTTTKTVITKIGGKKINQKKNFRVYVAPYKIVDGKKVTLGKSMTAHLVGSKNTKYSNVKKLTLTKSKYTVKVGKTAKIKAKVTLVNKNKKHIPKSHGAKFRYKSSDTSIATVDKNGKIKGIRKGTCTIYVYSINGLMKKAKVTVK